MQLQSARTTSYKSIDDSSVVEFEPTTTVLVGMNEAGKSAFLESMHKARPADENPSEFNYVTDYLKCPSFYVQSEVSSHLFT